MIRTIVFISCILMIISCGEKKYSPDLLTDGAWIIDNRLDSSDRQTIQFNSDGTYLHEIPFMDHSKPIPQGTFSYNRPVKLSGDWLLKENDIQFTNSIVSIPEDTNSKIAAGQYKVNALWGEAYSGALSQPRFLGVYRNDSTTLELCYDFTTGISSVFGLGNLTAGKINDSWSWTIIKLTEDSLMVSSHKRILKYYRQLTVNDIE